MEASDQSSKKKIVPRMSVPYSISSKGTPMQTGTNSEQQTQSSEAKFPL